jgi:hypothetical protein
MSLSDSLFNSDSDADLGYRQNPHAGPSSNVAALPQLMAPAAAAARQGNEADSTATGNPNTQQTAVSRGDLQQRQ